MNKIRTFVAALCGVAIAAPAMANTCLRPEERPVFDMFALRSYLMVSGLQCNKRESYNDFMRRYGANVAESNRVVQAHFTRAHGGQGRTRFDAFNTSIANEHSEDAIRGGGFFCRDAETLFVRVLATPAQQLPQLAAERNIPQTYGDDCGAAPATPARPAARSARTSAR
jgi:hypothetical protein